MSRRSIVYDLLSAGEIILKEHSISCIKSDDLCDCLNLSRVALSIKFARLPIRERFRVLVDTSGYRSDKKALRALVRELY